DLRDDELPWVGRRGRLTEQRKITARAHQIEGGDEHVPPALQMASCVLAVIRNELGRILRIGDHVIRTVIEAPCAEREGQHANHDNDKDIAAREESKHASPTYAWRGFGPSPQTRTHSIIGALFRLLK